MNSLIGRVAASGQLAAKFPIFSSPHSF